MFAGTLNLSQMDFLDDTAAIQWSRLIISCATQDASPNDCVNPEILKENHHKIIHSFGVILPAILPDTEISSCVCIVLLFETSSSSHVQYHIARQRGPLGPELAIGPCLTSSKHEIWHFHHAHMTLRRGILSHMDFPGGPAAFHGCRVAIPCGKQDAGPNELITLEISMENHPKITHSSTLILPAIFPDTLISLVPV